MSKMYSNIKQYVKNMIGNDVPAFNPNKPNTINQKKLNNIDSHESVLHLPCGYNYKGVDDWGHNPIVFVNPKSNGVEVSGALTLLPAESIFPSGSKFIEGCSIGNNSKIGFNSNIAHTSIGAGTTIQDTSVLYSVTAQGHLNIGVRCAVRGSNVFNGTIHADSGLEINGKSNIFKGNVVTGNKTSIGGGKTFIEGEFKTGDDCHIKNVYFSRSVELGVNSSLDDVVVKGELKAGNNLKISGETLFLKGVHLVGASVSGRVAFEDKDNSFTHCNVDGSIALPIGTSLVDSNYNPYSDAPKRFRGSIGANSELINTRVNLADIGTEVYLSGADISLCSIHSLVSDENSPSTFTNVVFDNAKGVSTELIGCVFKGTKNVARCDMDIVAVDKEVVENQEINIKKQAYDLSSLPIPEKGVRIDVSNAIITGTKMSNFEGLIAFDKCTFSDISVSALLKRDGFLVEASNVEMQSDELILTEPENDEIIMSNGDVINANTMQAENATQVKVVPETKSVLPSQQNIDYSVADYESDINSGRYSDDNDYSVDMSGFSNSVSNDFISASKDNEIEDAQNGFQKIEESIEARKSTSLGALNNIPNEIEQAGMS